MLIAPYGTLQWVGCIYMCANLAYVNTSKDVGEVLMSVDGCQEKDIKETAGILKFIENLKEQSTELVLSSNGESVGAILTEEQ